jgi:hypothetical protein
MRSAFLIISLQLMATAVVAQEEPCEPCRSITVSVFFGLDCPISQKYVPRLNELVKTNASFRWEFLIPAEVKRKEISAFRKEYQPGFDLVIDPSMKQTMKFGVTVTPEVVVADAAGQVLYQGAIDNWFYELGRYRQFITEHYLTDALDAIAAGKPVPVTRTEAVGCLIQMPAHHHH